MPAYEDLTGEEQDAFDKQVLSPAGGGAGGVDTMGPEDLPADGAIVDRGTGRRRDRISLTESRIRDENREQSPSEAAAAARAALAKGLY